MKTIWAIVIPAILALLLVYAVSTAANWLNLNQPAQTEQLP